MVRILSILVSFSLLLTWSACNDNKIFSAEKEFPNGQWAYRDTVDFTFHISDTTALCNMYLTFTTADTFPTQNIYLKLHTRFPDGKRLSKVRSFDLFDAKGESVGRCSSGECKAQILLQDNAYFNKPGDYTLTLEQFTRQSELQGIKATGLNIEKTGQKR